MTAMEAPPPPVDILRMTKVQKLAALLILLGPESAAQLLKAFDQRELEVISREMSRLQTIPAELQTDILREFTDVAVEASTAVLGGVNYTRNALEKSVGQFRAADIIGRVAPAPIPASNMQQFTELDPREIANLIRGEQPQTIALLSSYLTPEKCAAVLLQLPAELRHCVVERLATLAPTPVEAVERVVSVLGQRAGGKTTRAMQQTGGVKNAADLLNSLDLELSQSVLTELERSNPELTQAIRQKMFTFEDMARLDNASLQKIMREVDMRDLAVSLKDAPDKLQSALLAAISRRAAETVKEEISFLGQIKKNEIEAAQLRIIDSVRALESQGEIDLSAVTRRSSDELMV